MGKDTVRAERKFHNKNTKATKVGPISTADERRFAQIRADARNRPHIWQSSRSLEVFSWIEMAAKSIAPNGI